MKCDWDGVKRLGTYLGCDIDDGLTECPGSLDIICRSLGAFDKKYSRETCARLARLIFKTGLSKFPGEEEREETLARETFNRLHLAGGEEAYIEFGLDFKRFIRWFKTAVDAVHYLHGLRKEIVCLERPGVKDYVSELKELPCRRLGELNFSNRTPGYAAVSKYIEALLGRYKDKPISGDNCRSIMGVMNKVSGYPGYFKAMSAEQKLIETRPILIAISDLQLHPDNDPGKADLLSALGILLFNVFPAPKLLKFITRLQPSAGNDALQYDYNAILAMNFMLAGRLDEAASHNKKALEHAVDEEKRAYTHILECCIRLNRGEMEEAVNALYRCSALIKDRRIKSTALFYMGIIHYEMGKVPDAFESFRLARAGLEDELDIMNACNDIGTCAMLLGDFKVAATEFENVEYIGRYMSSNTARSLLSVACGNLGLICLTTSKYDRAIEYFKEALRLSRDIHNKKGIADQLGNIGLGLKAKHDYDSALIYFKSALNVSSTEGYLEGALFSFSRIEQLKALEGRYEEAEEFQQEMARRNPDIAKMLRL
jgi:tetratricopeptide (TPR) repeat protein